MKNIYIDNIENTEIKESKIHGYGLFATKSIRKDQYLCNIQGQIITRTQYKELLESGKYPKECFIEKYNIDQNRVAMMFVRSKYGYINHAETSNIRSELVGTSLYVYAACDIKAGEEITDVYNLKKHFDVLGGFKNES